MNQAADPRLLPCGHPVTGYRQVRYRCGLVAFSVGRQATHVSARCEVCGPYPTELTWIISEPLTPGARAERARLRRVEKRRTA